MHARTHKHTRAHKANGEKSNCYFLAPAIAFAFCYSHFFTRIAFIFVRDEWILRTFDTNPLSFFYIIRLLKHYGTSVTQSRNQSTGMNERPRGDQYFSVNVRQKYRKTNIPRNCINQWKRRFEYYWRFLFSIKNVFGMDFAFEFLDRSLQDIRIHFHFPFCSWGIWCPGPP